MAGWQPDEALARQLCEILAAAGSANTQAQQQVLQALNQLSARPDFMLYALAVFAQMPTQPTEVRQRAGLLLKNSISGLKRGALGAAETEHINSQVLVTMQDPNKAIRHTGGSILTTAVQKLGFASCSKMLEQLVQLLESNSQEVLEGSLSALSKICEDGVDLLARVGRQGPAAATDPAKAARAEEAKMFLTWASQRVFPPMFVRASPSAPTFVRQSALECLNHFALQRIFEDDSFGLQAQRQRYVETLGALAGDSESEVLQLVCKGFCCAVEEGWNLTFEHYKAILTFMLKACQNPDYDVRMEALGVWCPCAEQPDSWGALQPLLQELVPVLLNNMVYAEADYMILEPSQVENDNANVPDSMDSIKPRFHTESKNIQNVDGDEDDEAGKEDRSSHGWGLEWTARKAAAKSLDYISGVHPEVVVPLVLPLIEQKLNHASWEHQEAGVLALGAIGVNCQDKLQQFLPAVIGLLLRLCEAQQPLLRSISSWCVSRFGSWIFGEWNPGRAQVIPSVLKAILPRCLDRNKRCQEASISALMTLEECGQAQIVPFLNDIVETLVKSFSLYQLKNQRILYDTVNYLVWAVGSNLCKPEYLKVLIEPVLQKFEVVPDGDVLAVPIAECVASFCQMFGQALAAYYPKIVMKCLKSINDTAMATQMWEQNPNEYERPEIEIMACCCDVLSGIYEGLKENIRELLAKLNFLSCISLCVKSPSARVKQSGYWLLSLGARDTMAQLQPVLPELMPLCAAGLGPKATVTVSMNACWAISEVYSHSTPDAAAALGAHLGAIVPALVEILQRKDIPRWQLRGHDQLLAATCSTLNRLRQTTALGQQWPTLCNQLAPELRTRLVQRYGLSS